MEGMEEVKACLFGFFIGDALGVPVEFENRSYLKENKVMGMLEYGTHNQPKGTWSDDSSMLLATIDGILKSEEKINYKEIMNNFLEWKKTGKYTPFKEVFDIGNSTREAIDRYEINLENDIDNIICGSNNINSNGNGSLMRILPITLYLHFLNIDYFEKKYLETIATISSMTHAHEYSILSCYIYSIFTSELMKEKEKRKAFQNMQKILQKYYENTKISALKDVFKRLLFEDFESKKEEEIASSGYCVDSLETSIWCILNTNNFEEAVLTAVNLGNDTDTIGALTASLAGVLYGYESIPNEWIECLQKKEYLNEMVESFIIYLKEKSREKGEKSMDLKLLEETIKDLETNKDACILHEKEGYGTIIGEQLDRFIKYLNEQNLMDKDYVKKDIKKEISEMNVEEILTTITKIIRSERFVSGEIYFNFKNQTLLNLIKRLYELSK